MKIFLKSIILISLSQFCWAQEKFVTASGQCQSEVTPDRFNITFTSQSTQKTPDKASQVAMQSYEKLRTEVKKMNLKDIQLQTSQYSINPDWKYENNKQQLQGYIARISLKVESSDNSKISNLLELAAKLGIQEISSPTSFLSNELATKEYESCLTNAVKNARSKAEKLAHAAGAKVGEVIAIEESKETSSGGPVPRMDMMAKRADSAIGIEIKPETVSVNVFAKFSLK